MVYSKSKAPTTYYYSTLHDSITSLCKTILPSALKKRCLVSAEHRLWKLQSHNLKWQQDSLHQMLNLMSLHKDDILSETEVSAFKTHLLDTLLASPPPQQDHPLIIKHKLMFLQELLHAKCISEGEYHSSRTPLLQRLAAQGGGEIEVVIAGSKDTQQNSEEEWSVIDLKDEQCLKNKENSNSKKKVTKGLFSFGSSHKPGKKSNERSIFDSPALHMNSAQSKFPPSSIYTKCEMRHSKENPFWDGSEKTKRKPFRTLFHRDKNERGGDHQGVEAEEEREEKSAKKQWGFDGLIKWKRSDSDDDTLPLSLNDQMASSQLSSKAYGEVLDTKLMNDMLHSDTTSPSHFSKDDKVLGTKINELSRVTEMRSTNTKLNSGNDQMQTISAKLPEEKTELKNNFPKPWCDRYGDENSSMGWTTFEDDENLHPNLFIHEDKSLRSSYINPFSDGYA
ncbi:hypothetical protein VNO77_42635 [Canavalia gladiata]|uniref:Uncharacterized protein n=1 Tax=Canavalia gladiata TaxID=3824 RepID=A0AAN9JT87_CANGL